VEPLRQGNGVLYRVRVGPELLKGDAEKLLKQIRAKLKLDGIIKEYP
jgi:cell division septation protein DedD